MKDVLGARGLAALGWLSAFNALWHIAIGNGLSVELAGVFVFSLLVALIAGASIKERSWHSEFMPEPRKGKPPAWTDRGGDQ